MTMLLFALAVVMGLLAIVITLAHYLAPPPVQGDPHLGDSPEDVAYEAIIRRCWESGNVVIGNKQPDGTWEVKELKDPDNPKPQEPPTL